MKAQKGFTLIELMIAVAIVGILAAVALPAYQDYMYRAQASEIVGAADMPKSLVVEYFNMTAAYPTNSTVAGFTIDTGGTYVTAASYASGDIFITGSVNSETVIVNLSATTTGRTVNWTCNAIDGTRYLPASCR